MAGVSQTWREETTRWGACVLHSSSACSDARGMKAAKKGGLPTGSWHSEVTTAETHQFLKGRAVQPSALSQDTTGVLSAWDGACSGVSQRAGGVEEVRMHLGAETTGHLLHCSTQETPLILFDESSRNIWIERWLYSNLCVTHFPLAFLIRQKISSGVNKPPA